MTVSCQVEPFSQALNNIVPLIDEHWREVGSFSDRFARHIHFEDYHKADRDGKLLTVTARDNGKLVGYFVGVFSLDLHRVTFGEGKRIAVLSALVYYLHPDYRGYGRSLIRTTEREAERVGVQIISIRVKPGMNGAGEFLTAMRYSITETTYSRVIGEASDAGKRSAVD
jgi:GNAT superfamily N-acetyltransferase